MQPEGESLFTYTAVSAGSLARHTSCCAAQQCCNAARSNSYRPLFTTSNSDTHLVVQHAGQVAQGQGAAGPLGHHSAELGLGFGAPALRSRKGAQAGRGA